MPPAPPPLASPCDAAAAFSSCSPAPPVPVPPPVLASSSLAFRPPGLARPLGPSSSRSLSQATGQEVARQPSSSSSPPRLPPLAPPPGVPPGVVVPSADVAEPPAPSRFTDHRPPLGFPLPRSCLGLPIARPPAAAAPPLGCPPAAAFRGAASRGHAPAFTALQIRCARAFTRIVRIMVILYGLFEAINQRVATLEKSTHTMGCTRWSMTGCRTEFRGMSFSNIN